jgi:hypothetical protein
MTAYKRHGFKWSINEILSLQREYELLKWDIDTIAKKHERDPLAILYKLDKEGFADNIEISRVFSSSSPKSMK